MNMRAKLSQLFSEFNQAFYPSVLAAPTPLGRPADPASQAEISGSHLDAGTSPLRLVRPQSADGLAAPVAHAGAASHPSQLPLTDVEAAGAEWLSVLRSLAARLGDAAADVVEHIDRLDPTPAGLAAAAEVTDLDAYRR